MRAIIERLRKLLRRTSRTDYPDYAALVQRLEANPPGYSEKVIAEAMTMLDTLYAVEALSPVDEQEYTDLVQSIQAQGIRYTREDCRRLFGKGAR